MVPLGAAPVARRRKRETPADAPEKQRLFFGTAKMRPCETPRSPTPSAFAGFTVLVPPHNSRPKKGAKWAAQ